MCDSIVERDILYRLGQILIESKQKDPWFYYMMTEKLKEKHILDTTDIDLKDFVFKFKEKCRSLKIAPLDYQSLIFEIKNSNKNYYLSHCINLK